MKNNLATLVCAVLPIIICATTQANALEFAEDFSNETALWTVDLNDDLDLNDRSVGSDVISLDDSVQLRVAGDSNSAVRGIRFRAPYNSDSGVVDVFKIIVQPDESSVIADGGEFRVRMAHHFHNTVSDFGFPERDDDSSSEGDVRAELGLRFGATNSRAEICLEERDFEGRLQDLALFENNTEACMDFALQPSLGDIYELELRIDRRLSEMTARINDEVHSFILPGSANLMANSMRPFVEASTEGVNDLSVLNVLAIETDRFVDDYRVKGAPRIPFDLDDQDDRVIRGSGGIRPHIQNGSVVMSISSDDGSRDQSRLNIIGETDYLETLLSLSSETSVTSVGGEEVTALTRLSGGQYDVFADGGLDSSEIGVAWGRIEIYLEDDQSTGARYCLERFDTGAPDFMSTPLLASGELCEEFSTIPELDTFYKTVIATDREAGTVTFSIDDESVVHDITEGEIFQEGIDRQFNAVRSLIDGASGTVVSFADDLRTDPDALTRDELRAAAQVDSDDVSSSSGGGGSVNIYFSLLLLLGLVSPAARRQAE